VARDGSPLAASRRRRRGAAIPAANGFLPIVRGHPGRGPIAAPCVVGENTEMGKSGFLLLAAAV